MFLPMTKWNVAEKEVVQKLFLYSLGKIATFSNFAFVCPS